MASFSTDAIVIVGTYETITYVPTSPQDERAIKTGCHALGLRFWKGKLKHDGTADTGTTDNANGTATGTAGQTAAQNKG